MLPQPGLGFTLLTYILMVAVLVVVHEGGHYLAGRMFGIKIDAFAVGFGRELFGWNDKRGTRWKVNLVPLGGYVKFTGDMNEASQPSPEVLALPAAERADLFVSKPLWQRAIVVAAGPAINFAFAILILAGFYMALGHPLTPPVVSMVQPGSAAAKAGIVAGDRIVSIDGEAIGRFEDIVNTVMISTGEPMRVVIARGGSDKILTIVPAMVKSNDGFGNISRHGQLGIARGDKVIERVNPFEAVGYGISDTISITGSIASTLKQVVTGQRSLDELGGPLKTGQVTGQQASLGVLAFIAFMAFFSINLGFINLLPIPMLDGGHLVLYAVEAIRRQPIGARVQELAFMSGFAALMTLMAVLTWNDLGSVGVWDRLSGWLS
ncbi:RIP metalloprotease RseP [Sandarakinorhabdus glacialis]|uniref:RIP metalloprotease RseP n=1 Tax=Sandarakinorhabdus glacialis TaxID=1614636 RepID=UPI00353075E1